MLGLLVSYSKVHGHEPGNFRIRHALGAPFPHESGRAVHYEKAMTIVTRND
jgi:hypothetical protein